MKIATKISLPIAILGLVLTIVADAFTYSIAKKALYDELVDRIVITSESRSAHIETYLQMLKSNVAQLSKSAVFENFLKTDESDPRRAKDFNMVMTRLARTKESNPALYEIMLCDASGVVLASSNKDSIGEDKASDPYFTGAHDKVYIKDVYFSDTLKKPLFGVSAPVTDSESGKFLGVVVIRVELKDLYAIVTARTGMGRTGEVYIVNKDGYMITPSRFHDDTFLKQKVDTENYRLSREHASHELVTPDLIASKDYRGEDVLGAHYFIPELRWSVLTEIDKTEAYAPLRLVGLAAIIVVLVVPPIAMLAGGIIAKFVTDPIHKLHEGTEIIGAGNLDYRVGTSTRDEIGQLSRAFDAMTENIKRQSVSIQDLNKEIEKRKEAEAARRLSEQKLRALFDQTFQFIGMLSLDGTLIEVNKTALEFSGIAASDVIDKPFWHGPWWRHSSELQQKVRDAIGRAGRGEFIRFEATHPAKDGTEHYVDFSLKPVKDSEGKVIFLVPEGRDITESKKMQADITRANDELAEVNEKLKIQLDERKKSAERVAAAAKDWSVTFDSMGEGVSIHSPEFGILNVNKTLCDMLGKTREELVGQKCYEIFHGKNSPIEGCPMERSLRSGKKEFMEVFEPSLDRWLAVSVSPILDDSGEIKRLVHVVRDVTERKKAEAKIAEATETKSQFVSMVSHELRTPLTAMKESIGIVLDGSAGPINEEQKDFLDTAKRNVDRLSRLINDVLDYQRLEAGRTTFYMQKVDVSALINEVVGVMQPIAKSKNIGLEASVAADLPGVIFDKDKITQVLINLVNNAVKFTDQGSVAITVSREGTSLSISVKDSGVGIKQEDIPKLFHGFTQLEAGRLRKVGSTGLGLSISKKIIDAHKGKIWVESEYGKGSDFRVSLPIKERYKALVVDDEKNLLEMCRRFLESEGYEVATSEKGLEAIEMIGKDKPDILITDMRLDDINGYEMIGRLRSDNATAMIPILVMSGYAEELARLSEKREEMGLLSLAKPFHLKDLLVKIHQLLNQQV